MDNNNRKTNNKNNNKSDMKSDSVVKYKGVTQKKCGKFNAEIGNQKKGCRVWLGTFSTAIEAAKAYDEAAIQLYGATATLNFPTHIPVQESNDTVSVSRKRKRPSRYASVGLSKGKKDYFRWTDESLVAFSTILKKHINVNSENSQSKWDDLQLEFEKAVQHKFNSVQALKSMYDVMTKRYKLWKSLKDGEIDLRWNETAQELNCSDDWWKRKIKEYVQEYPEFKKIQKRQPSKALEEAWDRLYEDVVSEGLNSVATSEDVNMLNVAADGVDSVAVPSVDTNKSIQVGNFKDVAGNRVNSMTPSVDPQKSNEVSHVNLKDVAGNKVDGMTPSVDPNKSNQVSHDNLKDVVGNRVDGMTPSKNPKKSDQVPYVNLVSDDEDEDVGNDKRLDVRVRHTIQSSQYGNMKIEEAVSVSKSIHEVRQEDQGVGDGEGSKRSQMMAQTDTKPESSTRDSNRAKVVKEVVTEQDATQHSVVPRVNQVGNTSIRACIGVINRMVKEGLMKSYSDLWCFTVNLFEDDVKRELFMSLDDDGRIAWLKFKRNPGN